MTKPVRIGMIGLDTSHVPNFTALLNDPENEHHVPGGRVVAAYPGGSPDFELSWSRVEGYTNQLREEYGVEILDSPAAVAEAVDLVFIMSVDGRVHLEQFQETFPLRRPTYIDKPFAVTVHDAEEIFRLAGEAGVPVMSSSAMRFVDILVEAVGESDDSIVGCNVFGPMPEEPTQPGLFWYGVHTVEIILTVMGTGCREVRTVRTDGADLVTLTYDDGRMASLHGLRTGSNHFGVVIHHQEYAPRFVNLNATSRPRYAGLLEAIMETLPNGTSAVPREETLEAIRIMEAANESRAAKGNPVSI